MAKSSTSFKKGNKIGKGAPYAYETYSALLKRYNLTSYKELDKLDLYEIPAKHAIVIKSIKTQLIDDTIDPRILSWMSEREDGKVKDELELTNTNPPDKIQVEIVKPKKH